ncbi:MAG: M13 family metallopeptidase [Acidobacteria bacterium]|nr:M13 family metallopeptidase [Acidobacteriota bacterium]
MPSLHQIALAVATAVPLAAQKPADKVPGFDPALLDRATDPCVNFYQFACGTWLSGNPVPADQSTWGRFQILDRNNKEILRDILERAADRKVDRTPVEAQIGDSYAACMDEAGANRRGAAPLKPLLDRISKLDSRAAITPLLASLHRDGTSALFHFGSAPNYHDSRMQIAELNPDGMSLPDRDFYVMRTARYDEIRAKFAAHVERMFVLTGTPAMDAKRQAAAVLAFETSLAEAALARVAAREPKARDHRMTLSELKSLAPSIDWPAYFRASGAPTFAFLNVAQPGYMIRMESLLAKQDLDSIRTYLRWQVITAAAPLLSKEIEEENFAFFDAALRGLKQMPPRWRRCTERVDRDLGEALGMKYVERQFQASSKERMAVLVSLLGKALEKDIRELDWMTPETKKRALEKLNAITNKIGHPDKWRDYSRVKISREDALANARSAAVDAKLRDMDRIGQPVDKLRWFMTPPTVNAYYIPNHNSINFPAGILQPPFFDPTIDDAVNFGAIGAVIGHEMSHGFDDKGRKFDAQGNLIDWWTEADAREFERRAQCFVDQFGHYDGAKGMKLNGKLTLGENTADAGGVRVAYMALMMHLAGKDAPKIDGFTPQQRFFLGYGQIWCRNATEEAARMRVATDPHSPGEFRVNGIVSNMPEFREAFGCRVGQPMARENACRVW